jgi:hypothetical protein
MILKMIIKIIKGSLRHRMICERTDKSAEMVDLGPNLPYHDIAHFVVESELKMADGFYGNIEKGFTIVQLSDKEIIKTLPDESMASEIITRTLQTLGSGATTIEQFDEMILEEFKIYNIQYPIYSDKNLVLKMLGMYKDLLSKWENLNDGDVLEMNLL